MKPVVEFLFKETLPVGDKSSQNPSTITGVSSIKITRSGKNLAIPRVDIQSESRNGLTFTVNDNATYTINGTASTTTIFYVRYSSNYTGIPLVGGVTYTLSGNLSVTTSSTYYLFTTLWPSNVTYTDYGEGTSFSRASISDGANIGIRINSGISLSNVLFKPQLELGSNVTEFETPIFNDYTISFNHTYYGGILDVSTGKLTVTHRMIEADSLTLDISDYPAYLPLECTDTFGRTITSTGNILALTGSTGGKIVYKLANPYTVQIDPVVITALPQVDKYTPRLNTLYTDAENITVKYIKSPIRDEYEKVQAIIANGGTV